MKSISHNLRKKLLLTSFFLVLSTTFAMAQDSFDEDVDDEVVQAPIDGFITVGLIAGAFLGIRKLKKSENV